jgi:hypothetical protein
MKRHNTRRLLLLGAAVLMSSLSGCGGGSGEAGPPPSSTQPTGRVVSFVVNSTKVGYAYGIDVYLPASYDTGTAAYPAIYALDGDARFNGSNTRFEDLRLILQQKGSNAILVGIGGTARRQTDYNFPGANAYHAFITDELIPAIDTRFRTQPGKRMLSGLSTSGNFAASALFLEAPTQLHFSHFLSAEGAFWQQLETINSLEEQMYLAVKDRGLPVTLILARATGNGATNATYVHDLFVRMDARRYPGLTLLETSFPTTHAAVDYPAFEDAVGKFFP